MAGRLLLVFLLVPVIETWVLIRVGSVIGVVPTIALVILTAVVGSQLARHQGLRTIREIQACQQRGEVPALPMIEGAVLLVGGVMVALPGLVTDFIGLLMLVPPIRRAVAVRVLRRAVVAQQPGPRGHRPGSPDDPHTIEGQYRRDD